MKKDQLLEEFRKFELESNSNHDARKFVLGGFVGSPETDSDGKKDDCVNDTPPPPPQPIVAMM